MYKTIIFDLDGTLLDTIEDLADAGNYVLSQLNLPLHTKAEFQYMVGGGIKQLVEKMLSPTARGGEMQKMAYQMFMNYYSLHNTDKTKPFKNILPMLNTFKKAGVTMAVLSNKDNNLTNTLVEKHFPDIFTITCGHVPDMPLKPNPQSLLAICKELAIHPSEVLYVGDSETDVLTAKNANIDICGVLWGYRTKQQLQDAGANLFSQTPINLCELALGVQLQQEQV